MMGYGFSFGGIWMILFVVFIVIIVVIIAKGPGTTQWPPLRDNTSALVGFANIERALCTRRAESG